MDRGCDRCRCPAASQPYPQATISLSCSGDGGEHRTSTSAKGRRPVRGSGAGARSSRCTSLLFLPRVSPRRSVVSVRPDGAGPGRRREDSLAAARGRDADADALADVDLRQAVRRRVGAADRVPVAQPLVAKGRGAGAEAARGGTQDGALPGRPAYDGRVGGAELRGRGGLLGRRSHHGGGRPIGRTMSWPV